MTQPPHGPLGAPYATVDPARCPVIVDVHPSRRRLGRRP